MTAEDLGRMIELCKQMAKEADSKRLALWITELNQIIQRRITNLKKHIR